jgi:hypothetical protein
MEFSKGPISSAEAFQIDAASGSCLGPDSSEMEELLIEQTS